MARRQPFLPYAHSYRTDALRAPAIRSGLKSSLTPLTSDAALTSENTGPTDPDTQAILDTAYPQQPAPKLAQSPDLRLGPVNISGSGLDQAALAAMGQLPNMPPPRNFRQGLVGGLASGLIQGRANQAVSRSQANAAAIQQAHQDDIDRRKLAATLLAQSRSQTTPITDQKMADFLNVPLKTRVNNSIFAATLREMQSKPTQQGYIDITENPEAQKFVRGRGALPTANAQGKIVVPEAWLGPQSAAAAGAAAKEITPDQFASQVKTTRSGIRYLDKTNLPTDQAGNRSALAYTTSNNIPLVDKANADRLTNAEEVYRGLDDVEGMANQLLSHQKGPKATFTDVIGRAAQGAKNVVGAVTQLNPTAAAFNNTRVLGIRAIQALAAGQGSGFRLNQAEVNLMTQRWPSITDSYETAQAKLEWERRFLQNKESAYFGRPQMPLPVLTGFQNPASMPSENPPTATEKALKEVSRR